MLAFLPLNYIFQFKHSRLLFFVKSIRLLYSKELLEYKTFMKQVRGMYQKQLDKDCSNPEKADDIAADNTSITSILIVGYLFKTFRMTILLAIFTYMVGMLVFGLGEVFNEIEQSELHDHGEEGHEFFASQYLIY